MHIVVLKAGQDQDLLDTNLWDGGKKYLEGGGVPGRSSPARRFLTGRTSRRRSPSFPSLFLALRTERLVCLGPLNALVAALSSAKKLASR